MTGSPIDQLLAAIDRRLRECKLEMHPEKSGVVYCKNGLRRETYPRIQFTFLGYTFRPRRVQGRDGKAWTGFLPAFDREAGLVNLTVFGPEGDVPDTVERVHELGADFWPLAMTRELDDLLASLDPSAWHPEARREVLDRLLLLNHQRHAEEVAAGLVDESGKSLKGKTKAAKSAKSTPMSNGKGVSLANYWTTGSASNNGQASAKDTADDAAQGDEEQTTLL